MPDRNGPPVVMHPLADSAALPELLSFASHELREPLSTILASTHLLARTSAAERRELVATIAAEANRMLSILDNLLTYARLELGHGTHAEPVLLGRIVESAVARVRADHPDAQIRVTSNPGLTVEVDAEDVELVLGNYLSNARKYGGGEPIEVEVRRDRRSGAVLVLDRGPGIAPQDRASVFEPFYRVPSMARRQPGLGIGLALCRRLVAGYGGRVWTEARPGGGTIFGFSLPLVLVESI
jgi:two-component system sensor histidine kinase KdpD